MRTLARCLLAATVLGCGAGGGDPIDAPVDALVDTTPADAPTDVREPGRYYAFMTLERWSRGGAVVTGGGLQTYFHDWPEPSMAWLDTRCLVHGGEWAGTGRNPPSYGALTTEGLTQGTVTWIDSPEGPWIGVDNGFDTGSTLTTRSTGGDIPAFTFTATVPAVPVLTSHDNTLPGPGMITIPRTAPLALTWQPVAGELLVLFLQATPGDFHIYHGIQCFFPADAGAGEVPREALATLQSSAELGQTNFYVALVSRERRTLPTIDLDLLLWNGRMTRVTIE
jgi:hypothetical protein